MRFFFYGTLQSGSRNPVARRIHARLVAEGPGQVRGALHAVPDWDGWFPALLGGPGIVHGQVYGVGPDFSPADLAAMDTYEDFDPADPTRSLYLRRSLPLVSGGVVQVYCFNRPLPPGARPIPDGDFRAWLASTNRPEFGGGRGH
jgi:gamma-glutamylcyclotransferase (GGCT)/AIG2-like uncharacterized protein YtfP